jgi:hypothetical protein
MFTDQAIDPARHRKRDRPVHHRLPEIPRHTLVHRRHRHPHHRPLSRQQIRQQPTHPHRVVNHTPPHDLAQRVVQVTIGHLICTYVDSPHQRSNGVGFIVGRNPPHVVYDITGSEIDFPCMKSKRWS